MKLGLWRGGLLRLLAVTLLVLSAPLQAAMNYVGHGPEAATDHRYDYHWSILRLALDATGKKWGPYRLTYAPPMNEKRQLQELGHTNGRLNVVIRETNRDYEKRYLPVRIPIDRGLLGYRVLLINRSQQADFAKVQSLADLRPFRIIQGADWGDVAILRQAGLTVVTDPDYDGLFRMLARGHGDAFCRGVTEVEGEMQEQGARYPRMGIEKTLLLYYPLPTYFWFPRTPQGEKLAQRAEEGMRLLMANGEFQRLFLQYHGELIDRLALRQRKLIRIDNPDVPESTPFGDASLWFDPLKD